MNLKITRTIKTVNPLKTKSMKTTIKVLSLAAVALFATSCDDDDPVAENEEEVITTVRWTLTNDADSSDIVVLSSVDADGDGPGAPVVTVSKSFTADATYSGDIVFRNDLEDEDITAEVRDESDEHEVFYITAISDISISKDDNDDDGNPLGLETTLETGDATSGVITVTLRHEPTKPNNGTLSEAGGETDIQVSFSVSVQ